MAIQTIAQLKAWFRRGLYPTEGQFADLIDSFRHKSEKVPLADVSGLTEALNNKYDTTEAEQLEAKVKKYDAVINQLQEEQENQGLAISEIHQTDEAQQAWIDETTDELAKIRELIKSGATIDEAKTALLALGSNYAGLYALAVTVKTFLEASDTKDTTINTWQEIEKFLQGITDTESLTGLLNELERNITEAYNKAISEALAKSVPMTETTHAELLALKRGRQLKAGTWYRITDYETTVANDSEARSAGHAFDVIVLATGASELSEEARASRSERDGGYFVGAKLEAWKVWYCLENDQTRFQWVDPQKGKGVIYRLIDEWGNDCPYDFKNVQFKRFLTAGEFVDNVVDDADWPNTHYILSESMEGLGEMQIEDLMDFVWLYTFTYSYDREFTDMQDASLLNTVNSGEVGAYFNKACNCNRMQPYFTSDVIDHSANIIRALNNIVLTSYDETNAESVKLYGNVWEVGCFNMTFHEHCYSNKFGTDCRNFIGFKFYGNTLKNYCHDNTFGNSCDNNIFGSGCYDNIFGNDCDGNTFGNYCYSNTFGNYCRYNTFGNYCNRNTFGNDCYYNTFGNGCGGNTFGNGCEENTFGNYCQYNTFGNDCRYNTFGNDCWYNTFGNYVYYCKAENNVLYVSVPGGTNASNAVKNGHILSGTQGKSSSNMLQISFGTNKNYCQFAALNSAGNLKIWSPADMV